MPGFSYPYTDFQAPDFSHVLCSLLPRKPIAFPGFCDPTDLASHFHFFYKPLGFSFLQYAKQVPFIWLLSFVPNLLLSLVHNLPPISLFLSGDYICSWYIYIHMYVYIMFFKKSFIQSEDVCFISFPFLSYFVETEVVLLFLSIFFPFQIYIAFSLKIRQVWEWGRKRGAWG